MDKVIKLNKKNIVVPIMLGLITVGAIVGTVVVKNKKNTKLIGE